MSIFQKGQKFKSDSQEEVELYHIQSTIMGYSYDFEIIKTGLKFTKYEYDFCWEMSQGLWSPIVEDEPIGFKFQESTPGCSHKWVKYHGLIDQYEFCELCDKKKIDN